MPSSEQTVNVPQVILMLALFVLAVRYFFFRSEAAGGAALGSGSSGSSANVTAANQARAREADVERIQQVFPQVPRRSIMWDLQRNGGNVAATTERILSGRGLEMPPQSFQPPLPPTSSSTPASSSRSGKSQTVAHPDLITRYHLKSKIAPAAAAGGAPGEDAAGESSVESTATTMATPQKKPGAQAWSQNKEERQALLQRRRDEMILAARRKMEAKVATDGVGAGPGRSDSSLS